MHATLGLMLYVTSVSTPKPFCLEHRQKRFIVIPCGIRFELGRILYITSVRNTSNMFSQPSSYSSKPHSERRPTLHVIMPWGICIDPFSILYYITAHRNPPCTLAVDSFHRERETRACLSWPVLLQASHPPAQIEASVLAFVQGFVETLATMPPVEYAQQVRIYVYVCICMYAYTCIHIYNMDR